MPLKTKVEGSRGQIKVTLIEELHMEASVPLLNRSRQSSRRNSATGCNMSLLTRVNLNDQNIEDCSVCRSWYVCRNNDRCNGCNEINTQQSTWYDVSLGRDL